MLVMGARQSHGRAADGVCSCATSRASRALAAPQVPHLVLGCPPTLGLCLAGSPESCGWRAARSGP